MLSGQRQNSVAVIIEFEDVVQAHVDITGAVIHEHALFNGADQGPGFLTQGDDLVGVDNQSRDQCMIARL